MRANVQTGSTRIGANRRRVLGFATAVALTATSLPALAADYSLTPARAEQVRQSIAINTHLNYTDGAYARLPFVIDALNYIGVEHVRDLTPTPWIGGSAPLSAYDNAMSQGIRFTFLDFTGSLDPSVMLGNLAELTKRNPQGVLFVEGFNEVDHNPVKYNGIGGFAAAKAYQKDMYAAVKAHPVMKNTPVLDFTGWDPAGSNLLEGVEGRADYLNFHTYAQNGSPPREWFGGAVKDAAAYKLPKVMTEFGYATMPQSGWLVIGVDETAQAKGLLNGIFDSYDLGFERIYLYELVDQKPDPQGKNLEMHFGVFDAKFRKKIAAHALRNLTSTLRDKDPQALSFKTRPIQFSLTGLPKDTHVMAVEKTSGETHIVIWNEAPMWDRATGKPVVNTPANVTLTLTGGAKAITLRDPVDLKATSKPLKSSARVSFALPNHPVLVEITR